MADEQPPAASLTNPADIAPPETLTPAERAVWDELAPHAIANRTLTPETSGAFRDLCEAIVLRGEMLAAIQADGWTSLDVSVDGAGVEHQKKRAHPLISRWQIMLARVDAGRARFLLTAMGKPMAAKADKPVDPFSAFDQPLRVVAGGRH